MWCRIWGEKKRPPSRAVEFESQFCLPALWSRQVGQPLCSCFPFSKSIRPLEVLLWGCWPAAGPLWGLAIIVAGLERGLQLSQVLTCPLPAPCPPFHTRLWWCWSGKPASRCAHTPHPPVPAPGRLEHRSAEETSHLFSAWVSITPGAAGTTQPGL